MKQEDLTGVLLMAYGTPDSLDDVEAYYTHIRGGRRPSNELIAELKERYALVGGRTPLSEISEATRVSLERRLKERGERVRVYLGMKHWHPYIKQAVSEMANAGIVRAIGLVLAPHYSAMSVAGYYRYIDQAQAELGTEISIDHIDSWHLHPPYLEAVAARIRRKLAVFPQYASVTVIFTAHSLPQRILAEGDPYQDQLMQTAGALAKMLDLTRWTFSYQSAGRTAEPWLGPDIQDVVAEQARAGSRNILVAPIGFVSDHLEIFYDIDHEAQAVAREKGVTLVRTDSLNADEDFVDGLADLVLRRMSLAATSLRQ